MLPQSGSYTSPYSLFWFKLDFVAPTDIARRIFLLLRCCFSFDKPGIVALGPKNQLVIALDRCDAIEQKYFVIGEIEEQDMDTLANIGLYDTDANHSPFTPLQIICAKIFYQKTTPGYTPTISFPPYRF